MHLEYGYILYLRQYRTDNKNPKCVKFSPHQFIKIPFYPDLLLQTEAPYQISLALKGTCLGFHEAILAVVFLQGLRVSESQSNHPDSKGKNKETRGIVVKGR